MNEDYLWDKSGPPDAEIAALENLLAPLRQRNRAIAPRYRRVWPWLAAAAALLVLASGAWWLHAPARQPAWRIASATGSPRAGSRTLQPNASVYAGQLLETDGGSRLTLQSQAVGQVEIEPDSRLRVGRATPDQQRLSLDRGTIRAFIWAPPERFVVDTPSSKAIDLGCAYTLHVDATGTGLLTVEMGWVAFQFHGRESFIPAGAACVTRKQTGPGLPYFLDASAAFRQAAARFDSSQGEEALRGMLSEARPRDAITLWHLLSRVPPSERGAVYDRFAELVQLAPEVTRDRIVRGDRGALDQAWNALDLGNTGWWRHWRREW